jgi:transposase-like protein
MKHVRAIQRKGVSASAYAQRHGLAVKSLYYWLHKLKAAAPAVPSTESQSSPFVVVSVSEPERSPPSTCCTLVLESGVRLEMATLPAPEWLAALGRAAQGAR